MELKIYQSKALAQVKRYLELLTECRAEAEQVKQVTKGKFAPDFTQEVWNKLENGRSYLPRKNGLGEPLPHFCLKIPTGGGKTLLAVKAIDLINTSYRYKRTGLVLWVVPTLQIYHQTLRALRDRNHCYRQHLDLASGGRTKLLERKDRFTPLDVEESLCILLLMLPAASRQSKETLRMFRDSGGFQEFFPPDGHREQHAELLTKFPNLDCYEDKMGFHGKQVKTSLGNTLRILRPAIILDEGHKAYSELAQETLRGFNPSILLELSATPPEGSNILVEIFGTELHREGMIKLDLYIVNKASGDWKDTLTASIERRDVLERDARKCEANTGIYIRPICLIQVERTGADQRDSGRIHSEDVRERLIKVHRIPAEHIAVKTSEKDELKTVDDSIGLLSRECQIRFIITKQALQEGWDCSFAYVLTILTNPSSQNALTQLVGRILRQPYARKTGMSSLDESYVFCYQQKGSELLAKVEQGFREEGLGDLRRRIVPGEGMDQSAGISDRTAVVRGSLRTVAERIVLPVFAVRDGKHWRKVNVPMDIEGRIRWKDMDIKKLEALSLVHRETKDEEHIATMSEDLRALVRQRELVKFESGEVRMDAGFFARHLIDAIPNPWIAFDMGKHLLSKLVKEFGEDIVVANFVFIIEEARKHFALERERLSREVFFSLIKEDLLHFLCIGDLGFQFPKKRQVKSAQWLNSQTGEPLQRGLFDPIPSEEFNDTERSVAWFLDSQEQLLFWYRNMPMRDYAIQGWHRNKIFPDFIFATGDGDDDVRKIYVLETKGKHLEGNEDTKYKQSVFDLCNTLAKKESVRDFQAKLRDYSMQFEMVPSNAWEAQLNAIFQ